MKLIGILLLAFALPAQETQPPTAPQAEQKKEEKTEAKTESPTPSAESPFSITFDLGARWISDVRGDFNTYRSMVNLGEGIRLMGMESHFQQPGAKFLDTMHLQANSWGGDPYNTTRLDLGKQGLYRFRGLYSNIAYFNFLPSFANPGPIRGAFFNQRAYDIANRITDMELELLPGGRVIPYVAYARNTGFGDGITTFVSESNEYPLRNLVRYSQDTYRGGVRVELSRFHATVEQGGLAFKDDQKVYSTERLPGNRLTPILGQALFLNADALQAYGMSGDGIFTKVLVSSNPFNWLDLNGQFLYNRSITNSNFLQSATGNFVQLAALQFYSRQFDLFSGDARMPHSNGQFSAEIRPSERLRFQSTYMTDRYDNDTRWSLAQQLAQGAANLPDVNSNGLDLLRFTYDRYESQALLDITSRIMLRGGYRAEWGRASVRRGRVSGETTPETGKLRRHVGLAGANIRLPGNISMTHDLEIARGDRTYFRTSLQNYHRYRTQVRYAIRPSVLVGANYSQMENTNPAQGVNLEFFSRAATANVQFTPAKYYSVLAEYSRTSLRSDLLYLLPHALQTERSFYRDNAHTSTLLVDVRPGGRAPVLSIGGSLFVSSGSRPVRYYQPVGRFVLPLTNRVQVYSEWRWFGLSEPFYLYQGFRNHQILTGLRLSM